MEIHEPEVILLDDKSQEIFRTRIPTSRNDYSRTLHDLGDLVAQAESVAKALMVERGAPICNDVIPVGIGIPGSISRKTGLVKNANSNWLNGQPFQRDVSLHLKRDVKVTNDANCLAVSEATDGAGVGYGVVFAAILGTGCGAGVTCNGKPLVGPNGVGGEWGHNPLPWTSGGELAMRPCYCGKNGCQETFLSGTGLSHSFSIASSETLSGNEIAALAAQDHSVARQVLDTYIDQLARGLAAVVNVIDPDIIILGGGVSNISEIYRALPQILPRYVFGGECDTPVVQAMHGDSSGVRGAAWLNPI
ncbi:MAG: ROK family protein [Moraxellaceae bacterium]|nr:MAG: ROK family protein [Moraxellaceae bacterium]